MAPSTPTESALQAALRAAREHARLLLSPPMLRPPKEERLLEDPQSYSSIEHNAFPQPSISLRRRYHVRARPEPVHLPEYHLVTLHATVLFRVLEPCDATGAPWHVHYDRGTGYISFAVTKSKS
jgi:hypothetical protein